MPSKLPLVALGLTLCRAALPQSPPATLTLTFQEALERARANSPQIVSANIAALLAHEDTVQAKAALLPGVSGFSQYIYTQPNGTPSAASSWPTTARTCTTTRLTAHGDIYAPAKLRRLPQAQLAEAVARAKADIAARGLMATVVENYYGMVAAERKLANARQSLSEARAVPRHHAEAGARRRGGALRRARRSSRWSSASATCRKRNWRWTRRASASRSCCSRISARISPWWTISTPPGRCRPSPSPGAGRRATTPTSARRRPPSSSRTSTSSRPAPPACRRSRSTISSASTPTSSPFTTARPGNLGSVAQAQLNIPIWTWGAARSKVKQAELQLQQAKNDLSFTQRQLLAKLNSFYLEAQTASAQSLRCASRWISPRRACG